MDGYEVKDILKEISPVPPSKDADLIVRAYNFALKAHATQKRKSGEPYLATPKPRMVSWVPGATMKSAKALAPAALTSGNLAGSTWMTW